MPAVQRRCVALAAAGQPAMPPKKPRRGGIRDPLDPDKWSNPDFLIDQAYNFVLVLVSALILVMLGNWPLAVLFLIIITPFIILPF